MPDIFLSYSRDDQTIARRYAEALQREGFEVWWDQALHPGEAFDQVTEKALHEARAVMVLWSKKSVQSRWVRSEATIADRNGTLVPVMIEECPRPVMFELTQTAALQGWSGDVGDGRWQALLGSLRRRLSGAPAELVRLADPATAQAARRRSPRRLLLIGFAALVLSAGGLFAFTAYRTGSQHAGSSTTAAPRILVLPFVSRAPDAQQQLFADGLTEDIHSQLVRIPGVVTLGRETTFALRGASPEIEQLRQRYGADYVLSGAVLREGDLLRVIPALVDARDNRQLRLVDYQQQMRDVPGLQLQRDIAQDVATAVGVVLGAGDLPPDQGGTQNVEAWLKFQQFQSALATNQLTPEVLQLLRDALEVDSGFLAARLRLYLMISPGISVMPNNYVALLREQEQLARELESAPERWQVESGFRSWRLIQQHRWSDALAAAASVKGADGDLLHAFILLHTGCFSAALPHLQASVAANPGFVTGSQILETTLRLLGRSYEAEAEHRRLLGVIGPEQDAALRTQATVMSLLERGYAAPDPQVLQALRAWLPHEAGRFLGPRVLLGGEPVSLLEDAGAAGSKLRAALEDTSNHSETLLLQMSALATLLGHRDLALQALRIDRVERNYGWPLGIWQYPPLRTEPEFAQIVRDIGVPEFWRASGIQSDFCEASGEDGFTCHAEPRGPGGN